MKKLIFILLALPTLINAAQEKQECLVHTQTLNGRTDPFSVNPNTTIKELYQMVRDRFKDEFRVYIDVHQIILIYNKKQLKPEEKVLKHVPCYGQMLLIIRPLVEGPNTQYR